MNPAFASLHAINDGEASVAVRREIWKSVNHPLRLPPSTTINLCTPPMRCTSPGSPATHKSMGFSHEKLLILCQLSVYILYTYSHTHIRTHVERACMHFHVVERGFPGCPRGWEKNGIWFFPSCRRQRVFANDLAAYYISLLLFLRVIATRFRFPIYLSAYILYMRGKTWKPTSPSFVSSLQPRRYIAINSFVFH